MADQADTRYALVMAKNASLATTVPLGVGYYTVPEAARLLRMPARNARRWLGGYTFRHKGVDRPMGPLWVPHLPSHEGHIELDFRDLIELRFIHKFTQAGLSLMLIRACLDQARQLTNDLRPFSTRRFRTDGRSLFMETMREIGKDSELLDLKKQQYAIGPVLESSFKDLEIDDDVVTRWHPLPGKRSIIVDPSRAFGQPIAAEAGVPTITLADAVKAEGTAKRVAYLYGVSEAVVKDADAFERSLLAA
jgi:uncharacterized protein (DUF433 family)/DNA-binding transcriptional MerR regulator